MWIADCLLKCFQQYIYFWWQYHRWCLFVQMNMKWLTWIQLTQVMLGKGKYWLTLIRKKQDISVYVRKDRRPKSIFIKQWHNFVTIRLFCFLGTVFFLNTVKNLFSLDLNTVVRQCSTPKTLVCVLEIPVVFLLI